MPEMVRRKLVHHSPARCQLFKLDLIPSLSNSIFDIIGLAQTSKEYHQRFLRTDKSYNFLHKFHENVIQYLKNQTDFWQFRYSISVFDVLQFWFNHCS